MLATKFTSLILASTAMLVSAAWADTSADTDLDAQLATNGAAEETATEEEITRENNYQAWLDEKVCKRRATTGSRVRATRECHTRREWEQIRDANINLLNDWTSSTANNSN